MKHLFTFLLLLINFISYAQTTLTEADYEVAYTEIEQMLEGKTPLDLKKAIFTVENLHYNNTIKYTDFEKEIQHVALNAKQYITLNKLENYKTAPNFAAYMMMRIPSAANQFKTYQVPTITEENYDISSTYITNLLATKQGNPFALSLLYKLLTEELGGEAYISLAQNYAWIRHQDEQGEWVNLSVDRGTFLTDKLRIESLIINGQSLIQGTYFRPMTDKETVAFMLTQLAQQYYQTFGRWDDFTTDCALLSIEHYPPCGLGALQLLSGLSTDAYRIEAYSGFTEEQCQAKLDTIVPIIKSLENKILMLGVENYATDSALVAPYEIAAIDKDNPYHAFGLVGKVYGIKGDTTQTPYTLRKPQPEDQYWTSHIGETVYDIPNRKLYLYDWNDQLMGEDTLSHEVTRLMRRSEYDAASRGAIFNIAYYQGDYRYGFQGQEKDDEVSGWGNSYNFGERFYNSRLGVLFSIDPKSNHNSSWSPYVISLDNPVMYVDINGEWPGVTYFFFEVDVGGGIGYGLNYIEQSGVAYDDIGKTHFTMVSVVNVKNQLVEDNNPNFQMVSGASAALSLGITQDFKSDTFYESINKKEGQLGGFDIGLGPTPFMIGGAFGGGKTTGTLGLGYGYKLSYVRTDVKQSISLSKNDIKIVNSKSNAVNQDWTIRKGIYNPDSDSWESTVFVKEFSGKSVDTGIKVTSKNTTNDEGLNQPNGVWISEDYNKEKDKK